MISPEGRPIKKPLIERLFDLLLNFLEDFPLAGVLVVLLELELALYLLLVLAGEDDQVRGLGTHLYKCRLCHIP